MNKKRFVFKDSTKIKIGNFIGYKLRYQDENSGIQNAESIMLQLNGINYVATYSKVGEYNEENKIKFLESINIDFSKNPKQISNIEKFNLKESLLEIFISILVLIGTIFFMKKLKKK